MKYLFLFLLSFSLNDLVFAQEVTALESARSFMRTGDFDNAILVLNRALVQEPNNLDMQKDLTLAYYYKRDYTSAFEHVKPMLDREDADVQVYQVAGNVFKALEEVKEADKMYKKTYYSVLTRKIYMTMQN